MGPSARIGLSLLVLLCTITGGARAQDLPPVPPPPQQQPPPPPAPYPYPPPQQQQPPQPYPYPPQQQQPPQPYPYPPQQQRPPQPYPYPPQQQRPPPQPYPYVPPPPTGEPGPGGYYVAGQPGAPRAETPQPPADPGRRSLEEIVELHATLFGVGALSGFAVTTAVDPDAVYPWLLFPPLGGLLGMGTALLLDAGPGMRAGIPSAITTGSWWGLANGLLLWGAQDERPDATGVLALLSITSAIGSVVGGLMGWAARPTVAENRLTLSAGLWGGLAAWMSVLASDAHGNRLAYEVGIGGLNLLTLVAFVAGAASDVSLETVGMFNGGVFMGALVGLGIAGVVHAARDQDGLPHGAEITAAGVAIGIGSGLLIGLLVASLDEERDRQSPNGGSGPDVALSAVPVEGGLVFSASAPLEP